LYEAHRTHAYQHAAQRYAAHKPVTLAVGAINVCWLFPIALLVALRIVEGPVGIVVAYAPLVAGVLWFGAGLPSDAVSRNV
jgi:Fuc2NAc and GlcNAc transferase